MAPTPAVWLSVPDRSMDRVGDPEGAACKSVNRNPAFASASRLGVSISPQNTPKTKKPKSSARMMTTLERLDSKSAVEVKSVSERVDMGGDDNMNKKKNK